MTPVSPQTLLALERRILQLLIGLRLLQLANRLVVSILIRARIDLKEQIAFVDKVAFFKGNIDYVTADPRGYRDQLDRCGSSGELVPIHYFLLQRFADRDLGRWRAMRRRLLVVAAGQPKTERDNNQPLTADVKSLGRRDVLLRRRRKPAL